jgi:hypothetical protein
MSIKYQAIRTSKELRSILGQQCSPMAGKSYVIGPTLAGDRIAHCATCSSYAEAVKLADECNDH